MRAWQVIAQVKCSCYAIICLPLNNIMANTRYASSYWIQNQAMHDSDWMVRHKMTAMLQVHKCSSYRPPSIEFIYLKLINQLSWQLTNIGLVWKKICRKPLFFTIKYGGSRFQFSLKRIQWNYEASPCRRSLFEFDKCRSTAAWSPTQRHVAAL